VINQKHFLLWKIGYVHAVALFTVLVIRTIAFLNCRHLGSDTAAADWPNASKSHSRNCLFIMFLIDLPKLSRRSDSRATTVVRLFLTGVDQLADT
jgi:hypothetical protein